MSITPSPTTTRAVFQVDQERTLEESTYQYLRTAIAGGELAPGTKLVGSRLAAELKVSRITVANALKRLVGEGFAVASPYRETVVASLDEASLREIFLTRYALEAVVMREAARQLPPATLDELRAIDERLRRSIADQDAAAYRRLEREFHLLIYAASGLPMITALLVELWDRLEPYRGRRHNSLLLSERASDEHRLILQALQARDSDGLVEAMHAHVNHGYEQFRQAMAEPGMSVEQTSASRQQMGRKAGTDRAPAGSLRAALELVPDRRRGQGKIHGHGAVLALAVCAMLCGVRSRHGVAQWGQHCHPTIRAVLGLSPTHAPSVATVHRVFRHLDAQAFEAALKAWFEHHGVQVCLPSTLEQQDAQISSSDEQGQTLPGTALIAAVVAQLRLTSEEDTAPHAEGSLHQRKSELIVSMFAGSNATVAAVLAERELSRQVLLQ